MKIVCVGYRDWALAIYDQLVEKTDEQFIIFRSREEYDENKLIKFNPDLVLYYGWSWIVPEKIIKNFKCIMLHPSALPNYRGGSPIQNQIISGVLESAVTLFIMDKGIDTGPIVGQKKLSLKGDIKNIFNRIKTIGIELTIKIINEGLHPKPQSGIGTIFHRRKPHEGEITIDEIKNKPAEYLYNKIRMLQDPYPGAFIKTADNKKLLLHFASIDHEK